MTNQFNILIENARKASNIARNEFFEKVPSLFIKFDEEAVKRGIDRDLSRMAKRDEKTHEWDRFVKNKEKGLAISLKNSSVSEDVDSEYIRSGANLFWDEIVDGYAGQYKGSEFIPYFSNDHTQIKNTPQAFVDHAYDFLVDENYRLTTLQDAGYSPEQIQEVNKEFEQQVAPMYKQKGLPSKEALAEFVFTYGTNHPMLTVLGTTQKDLRRQRLENVSRDLGVFKISPLQTRDEAQALNSQATLLEYKKLRDIEEPPTEYTYADVVADKWDSQIRYGQTGEIIRNAVSNEDQFSLSLPEDPNFSIYDHPEIEEWSNEIGNPEFVKRIARSKSFAEAEALYFAARDETTKLARIEQYYQQNKFSKAVQMLSPISYLADFRPDELALDIGIGMAGDPVGLLLGMGEGAAFTKGLGAVVRGTSKKAILTRGLTEATFGGLEGALYMHLYGKHADPTRAPGDIVAGALLGGAIGGAFEFGIGESGAALRNRIAANRYVKNLRETANTLESLSDKYDATPTIEQSKLQPIYGGIPFPGDPFKRLRKLADDIEEAGKVTEQDVGITRDSIAQTEEILNRTIQSESVDIDLTLPEEARPFIKELIERGLTRTGNVVSDIFDENGNLITDLQGNPVNRYRIQIHEAENWLIFNQALDTIATEGEDFLGKFLATDIRFPFDYPRTSGGSEKRNRITKQSLTKILGITREDLDNFIDFLFLDEEGQMTMPGRDNRIRKPESEIDDLPTGVAKALLASYAFTNFDSVTSMKAVMDLLNIDPVTYGQLVKDGFITRPGVLGLLDFNNEFEVSVNKKKKVKITRRKRALGIGVDDLYGDFIRSQSEKEQGSKARVIDVEDVIIDPETGATIVKPTKKQVQENALKGIGQSKKKRKKRYFVDDTKEELISVDLPEFAATNAVFFDYAAVAGVIASNHTTMGLAHLQALRMIMGDPRLARRARLDKAWRDEVRRALESDDEDFLLESQTRTVSDKLKDYFEDYESFTSLVLEEMQKDLDDRSLPLSLIYESTIATKILVDLLFSDSEAAKLFGISKELDFITMGGTLQGPSRRHLVETLVTDFLYRITKGDLELSKTETKILDNLDERLKKNYRKKLAEFYSNSEISAWEKGNNPNLMTAFDRLVRGKDFSKADKIILRKVQGKLNGYEEMRKLVAEILTKKPGSFFQRYGISEAKQENYDVKMKHMEAGGVSNFLGDPRRYADDIDGLNDWWQSYVYDAAILERRAKQGSLSVIKDVSRIVTAIKKQKKMILGSVQQAKNFQQILEKREKAYLLREEGADNETKLKEQENLAKKIENIKTQISNIYTKYGVESLDELESLLEVYDNFLFTFNLDVESLNKDERRRQSTEIVFQAHQLVAGLRKMSDSMKQVRKGLVSGINDKRRSTAVSQTLARMLDNFTYDLKADLDPLQYANRLVIPMKLRGIPDRIIPNAKDAASLATSFDRLLNHAAFLGQMNLPWNIAGLDSNTNPFRGKNKLYSRTNLQNWIKDANNFIKGFTGFQDILEDIDLKKASNTQLATLAQDLIESLKVLEAEEILDFTSRDLGEGLYDIIGEMRPGTRTAVYNLYTRFIGMSDNIGVPAAISSVYTRQLTGRAKLIPLDMYIKNNFHMTLPQARYYLQMRAQNTPLKMIFALRDQGVDPGRVLDKLVRTIVTEEKTLAEALEARAYKVSTIDPQASEALAVLSLQVEEKIRLNATEDEIRAFLGEVGPTGLPKKIEDIILPSTHRHAWKTFLEELKQLPETIGISNALKSQTVFRGLAEAKAWQTTSLYQELEDKKRAYEILKQYDRHKGTHGVQLKKIIDRLTEEIKKITRLDRTEPFVNLVRSGLLAIDENDKFVFVDQTLEAWYNNSISKAIDAFADVEDVFERSKARFMRDINRGELEEAKDFFGYFMEDFDNHLMAISNTFEDIVDDPTAAAGAKSLAELIIKQLKRASNNAHVLAGLPEPHPEFSVNVFRLDLMNQANFIFTVRETMLNQNMLNKLQAFQEKKLLDLDNQEMLARFDLDPNKAKEISDKLITFSTEFSTKLRALHGEFEDLNKLFGTMNDKELRGFVETQKELLDSRRGDTEATKEAFIEKAVEDLKDRLGLSDEIFSEVQDDLRLIVMESLEEFDNITEAMKDDSFGMDPETIYADPKLTIQQETKRQQGLKLPKNRRRGPGGDSKKGASLNFIGELIGIGLDKLLRLMGKASADFVSFTKKTIDEAFGRMKPGEKVSARDWVTTWGSDVLDTSIGKNLRKAFNFLRSSRARANASEAGMIRKLGQLIFGSELAIVGDNGVVHSRAEQNSGYEATRQGVVKYRTRIFGQFASNLEKLRNERTLLAESLGFTEREFDALTRAFYTLIREQVGMKVWQSLTGSIEAPNPRIIQAILGRMPKEQRDAIFKKHFDTIKEIEEDIKAATVRVNENIDSIASDILRRLQEGSLTLEGYNLEMFTKEQGEALIKHLLGLEKLKGDLKNLLPEDSELRLSLDSQNLVNALDADSFRDLEHALEGGEIERIIGDSLEIQTTTKDAQGPFDIIKSPIAKAVLGQIIYKKIKTGARHVIYNVGTYTKLDLYNLMNEHFSLEDLKYLYTNVAELEGLSIEDVKLKVINELFGDDPEGKITLRLDRNKPHTAKVKEGFKNTYEYERLSDKNALGDKLNQNRLENFSINEITKADVIDELDNVGKRTIDSKIENDLVNHVNDDLAANNVVDDKGNPLQFKTVEELFNFFDNQIDELYKMGLLTNTKEPRLMLTYMKSLVTGRDPKHAQRNLNVFVKTLQKAATAMSTADFSIAALPELINITLRTTGAKFMDTLSLQLAGIKTYAKDIEVAEKKVNKLRKAINKAEAKGDARKVAELQNEYNNAKKTLDDLETKQGLLEDVMSSAGVGTEGALYRNTGSNRRSIIFDSVNPMFNPTAAKPELGRVNKLGREANRRLEDMATRAADGEALPGLAAVSTKAANAVNRNVITRHLQKLSLNNITEVTQKLAFNSMSSRLIKKIDKVSLEGVDLNDPIAVQALADEIIDPILAGQLGLSANDIVRMAVQVKAILANNENFKSKKMGITLYDLGSILNHGTFDPQLREKFQVALYNWVGQNVVRPDAGDLPYYVSDPFIGLLIQFRSFGMAQYHKQFAPALQRVARSSWSEKAKALGGVIGLTTLMNALYNMVNYYIYNKEEVDKDVEKFGGWEAYFDACWKSSTVGKAITGEDPYMKPETNAVIPFSQGIVDPFMGPVGVPLDVAYPITGMSDPFSWYDQNTYGGKYGMAEDIMRTSAAFRAGADVIDPARRAINDKEMDSEYWYRYTGKLSGRNKMFSIAKPLLFTEE